MAVADDRKHFIYYARVRVLEMVKSEKPFQSASQPQVGRKIAMKLNLK